MVVLPITAAPWLPWVTVTRVMGVRGTGITGPSAQSTACSAVSSAGEAPNGAVQPRNEGSVRKHGTLFFDAMRTAAVRYLAFNPIRARRASALHAEEFRQNDARWRVAPLMERVARLDDLLEVAPNEEQALTFETKSVIGRPLGSPEFSEKAEAILGRAVQPRRSPRNYLALRPFCALFQILVPVL